MPTALRACAVAPIDVAAELIDLVDPDRLERWRHAPAAYRPCAWIVRDEAGTIQAAALTSGRPATSAIKIRDVWWTDDDAARTLIEGVCTQSATDGDVAVKWEVPAGEGLPAFADELGFIAMRRPWAAVGTEQFDGYVRWLVPTTHQERGYYAQTTLFTCGAVAALIAAEGSAAGGFAAEQSHRDVEVGFWRRASNYPACEPIGLAVALHEYLRDARIEVALDTDGPALLEGFEGFDHSFRAELQADSLRQAGESGIPVRRDRVAIAEIVERVEDGEQALLLIDEEPMHGETGPHWIVAHARVGDALVVEDPWINVDTGETWVDTHELPVRPDDLDRLVRWSDEAYRGVVFAKAV